MVQKRRERRDEMTGRNERKGRKGRDERYGVR
jgi:hypothetical protein